MNQATAGVTLLAAVMVASAAQAQDDDLAAGEKLYASQCKVCHGLVGPPAGNAGPGPSHPRPMRLAMQQLASATMRDIPIEMTSGSSVSMTISGRPDKGDPADATRIAVAPPYGPNLRGVYGRPAGTIEGFVYSVAFLKSLKGMEWNDASLDVWITNPQKWVPGVYMFYKQPDPELRRKIIVYLKAN